MQAPSPSMMRQLTKYVTGGAPRGVGAQAMGVATTWHQGLIETGRDRTVEDGAPWRRRGWGRAL
jgi:hypothetical protein